MTIVFPFPPADTLLGSTVPGNGKALASRVLGFLRPGYPDPVGLPIQQPPLAFRSASKDQAQTGKPIRLDASPSTFTHRGCRYRLGSGAQWGQRSPDSDLGTGGPRTVGDTSGRAGIENCAAFGVCYSGLREGRTVTTDAPRRDRVGLLGLSPTIFHKAAIAVKRPICVTAICVVAN